MLGAFHHDLSGTGDFRFEHTDGEEFSGQYGLVSPREFHSRMGSIFGLGKTLGFGATSLTTLFYIADLVGQ